MADNNKEMVRVLKDIASELHQLNRGIGDIARAAKLKQFEDLAKTKPIEVGELK